MLGKMFYTIYSGVLAHLRRRSTTVSCTGVAPFTYVVCLQVLDAMEKVVDLLNQATGERGLLDLLLSEVTEQFPPVGQTR